MPNTSFFLLGPRQTGKSTWLRSLELPGIWFVNLLGGRALKRQMHPYYAAAYYGEIANYSSLVIRLPAWTRSPLKRLVSHQKFYLFDNGVTNAITHGLSSSLDPVRRGRLFEQFMVQETRRILDIAALDHALYFWRTNNGAEVDLLIERDGELWAAVEYKSRSAVSCADCSGLRSFHEDNPDVPFIG